MGKKEGLLRSNSVVSNLLSLKQPAVPLPTPFRLTVLGSRLCLGGVILPMEIALLELSFVPLHLVLVLLLSR